MNKISNKATGCGFEYYDSQMLNFELNRNNVSSGEFHVLLYLRISTYKYGLKLLGEIFTIIIKMSNKFSYFWSNI